ncbi:hypothetical protein KY289_007889 [Solanum tuberosum]|nr:hypothetical protein KY289_007889 [Solanum tuberosum]
MSLTPLDCRLRVDLLDWIAIWVSFSLGWCCWTAAHDFELMLLGFAKKKNDAGVGSFGYCLLLSAELL